MGLRVGVCVRLLHGDFVGLFQGDSMMGAGVGSHGSGAGVGSQGASSVLTGLAVLAPAVAITQKAARMTLRKQTMPFDISNIISQFFTLWNHDDFQYIFTSSSSEFPQCLQFLLPGTPKLQSLPLQIQH